jgi:1,4-dihydroxy-2-naphthoyl-CoA hydrolase
MEADLPFQLPVALDRGFDGLYGLELTELTDEVVRGRVSVSDQIRQQTGIVHGGVYAAIAESLASHGTAAAMTDGKLAAGLSHQTSFMAPITEGTIEAVATRRHRGRTTWVWEVEVSDDQGRLCVLSRVTVAVRDS